MSILALERALQDVNLNDSHPGARCGHTLTHVKDAHSNTCANAKVVLFGGTVLRRASTSLGPSSDGSIGNETGGGLREERSADAHALSLYDGRWRRVAIPHSSRASTPVGRMGHAAVAIGSALLIHGGLAADGTVLDDIHLLRLNRLGGSGHWERLGTSRTCSSPCARYGHGVAYVEDRYLVLFGGHSGRSALGDTWVLDTGPGGCYLGLGSADVTAPLPAGADAEAALEASRRRAAEQASGVRESGCGWRQILHPGAPSPRSFAAVAAGADAMYVCGGVSVQKTALRDSHRLERVNSGAGTAWQWRRMPDVPRARIDAAATVVAGRVHVAGGWVGERKLPAPEHNVLVLDEEDGIWDEVAVHGTGAGELCAARLALAACDDVLFTHGGMTAAPRASIPLLGETYAFTASAAGAATLHSRPLKLRGPGDPASRCGSPAACASPAAATHTPPAAAAPGARANFAADHSPPQQTPPATPPQPLPVSSSAATTMQVSPWHEIPADAPQETAVLETGLISGSDAPHADTLSQATPVKQFPPPAQVSRDAGSFSQIPAGRPPFPPPATAAAVTPEGTPDRARSRNASNPPSGLGSVELKRSASISRSLMWTPLPSFTRQDSGDGGAAEQARVAANALNPYSSTVAVEQTGPPEAAAAAAAARAVQPQRSFAWQTVETPVLDSPHRGGRGAAAVHGGNDIEPAQRAGGADAGARVAPADVGEEAGRVLHQLRRLKAKPEGVFKKFTVSSTHEEHVGHHSVILHATASPRSEAVIKFYVPGATASSGRRLFAEEERALRDRRLAPLLPPLLAVHDNASGALVDARGNPLPPAIVLGRGVPLSELVLQFWRRRERAADSSALHMPLACAARCLCEFHAAGLVHRDVRAGHILWFPDPAGGGGDGGSRCTLIDLSCALPAGTAVSLAGVKLAYAAPEIVDASFRGAGSIEVTQAHDEWALGVLIFEALTGHPAFDLWGGSEAKVAQQLRGVKGERLPWEDLGVAGQLGCFYKPLRALLRRDPRERLSVRQFYDAVNTELGTSTHVIPRAGDGPSDAVTGGGGSSGDTSDPAPSAATTTSSRRTRFKQIFKGLGRHSAHG